MFCWTQHLPFDLLDPSRRKSKLIETEDDFSESWKNNIILLNFGLYYYFTENRQFWCQPCLWRHCYFIRWMFVLILVCMVNGVTEKGLIRPRLTAHNWQNWKRLFLTCPCHEIYKDETVGLKSCKYTWKITIHVKMWNLGQFREILIFCQ